MKRKTILITGPTSGIGKQVALELARKGMRLVLVYRNQAAADQLSSELQSDDHVMIKADLSSFDDINSCVELLSLQGIRIDVLINNAGVFYTERVLSRQGVEMQFMVNYLAPFMLTNLILKKGLLAEESRIINVSSISHYFGKIRFNDLNLNESYNGLRAYEQSKLAIVLFTFELARRLKSTGIMVNCLSPGRVDTEIGTKHASGMYKKLWQWNKPILIPVSKGAETYLYLALDPGASSYTGKYFYRNRPVRSSFRTHNSGLATRLWQVSEQLTGITYNPELIHEVC